MPISGRDHSELTKTEQERLRSIGILYNMYVLLFVGGLLFLGVDAIIWLGVHDMPFEGWHLVLGALTSCNMLAMLLPFGAARFWGERRFDARFRAVLGFGIGTLVLVNLLLDDLIVWAFFPNGFWL